MSLQLSIKNKEDSLQKRMTRVKRQQEIAEKAANESNDQNEKIMREQFVVHKVWSQFLSRRMEKEMQKYHQIEMAFSKIKGCTGNSDVREMVTKFMTKEQTYAHLLR